MAPRPYDLPPMTALLAFETAARLGSFKHAATALNVTPGAVSHQIRALETELGIALFDRVHRGVALTEEGRELFGVLQSSFQAVSGTIDHIRRPAHDRAITISATTAVSALWLTPRITRFWRHHPDVQINQIVTDSPMPPNPAPDLSVFYGDPDDHGAPSAELFRDTLVPVAAPALANQHQSIDLATLAQLPLIHMNAENLRWTRWQAWFSALGHDAKVMRGTKVNNYMIALLAAQDGAGVVLGWQRLVRPYLENGTLAVLGQHSLPAPCSFYIQRRRANQNHPHIAILEDWLRSGAS